MILLLYEFNECFAGLSLVLQVFEDFREFFKFFFVVIVDRSGFELNGIALIHSFL